MRSVVTGSKCQDTERLETPENPAMSQLPYPVSLGKAKEKKPLDGICISKAFTFNLIIFVMYSLNKLQQISTNSFIPKQT